MLNYRNKGCGIQLGLGYVSASSICGSGRVMIARNTKARRLTADQLRETAAELGLGKSDILSYQSEVESD